MLGVWLLLWTTHPSVLVDGGTTCPSPAEVQGRLGDLMAGVPDAVSQDRARIEPAPRGLHIDLLRDDGGRIAERKLESSGSCADLAQAAAVIIATWEAQLRPGRMARVKLPPADRSGSAGVAVAAPQPAGPVGTPTIEAGLGAVGSFAFGDAVEPALGGVVFGAWSPRPQGFGVHASAGVAATRTATLAAPITTSWTRGFVTAGPAYRVLAGPARLDAHAGVMAGLLHMTATSVPDAHAETSPRFGAEVGVRVSTRWSPMATWLGVQGMFWATHDRLAITNIVPTRDVPRLELWLALGVSFGRI